MATVTRVHGSATQVGTLYSPNCNAYLITVKDTGGNAINLQAEDSYGVNAVVDGVIEMIVKEINPLAWYAPADTTGKIHVIMDLAIDDATALRTRIRNLGTTVGPNSVDVTGTTVTAASSITIA